MPGIDHQVASPFWTFLNSTGPVRINGQLTTERLFDPWFYATGYPITEAYWANVKIGGTLRLVLLQCFERRCLTYTPGNPAGFETEAGNVGQHYHYWRYVLIPGEGTPTRDRDDHDRFADRTTAARPTEHRRPTTATATAEPATEYEFVTAWGQAVRPGQRSSSASIAVATDSDGNVYVARLPPTRASRSTTATASTSPAGAASAAATASSTRRSASPSMRPATSTSPTR